MCLSRLDSYSAYRHVLFLHDNHGEMEPQQHTTFRLEHLNLAWAREIGVYCADRNHSLQIFFMLGSHLYTFTSQEFLQPSKGGQQLSFTSPGCCLLLLEQNKFPIQVCHGFWPGVVTERDAWSLWSVSQQQTVHTSRQCLGIVAHFRTSVHDTVSVVTLSSLVPHQRLTSCTPVYKYPSLTYTHASIRSHISPY